VAAAGEFDAKATALSAKRATAAAEEPIVVAVGADTCLPLG
jgi:hypothetical protein